MTPVLPDAARSRVEADRTTGVVANGRDAVTLTVTVVGGPEGTALADRTVTLEVSGEGNTVTPVSAKTDAHGVMTAHLVSTGAGSKRVRASVEAEGGPVVLSTQPVIDFVTPPATRLAFTATSLQATAGEPLSPAVEVVLLDADGHPAAGNTRAVTVELATGPASAELKGPLTVNAVDGVARFSGLVLEKAGTGYSLRATSGALTAATSPTFDVVPAAAAVLELTGLPDPMTAGSTAEVHVLLKDAFANVATHYTGTLRFSSTDPGAELPEPTALTLADAGRKSFPGVSLKSAGPQRVTVVDEAQAALTASLDVLVVAGAPARLVFTQQPGNHSVRAALGPVRVALLDALGNPTGVDAPAVTVALDPASGGLDGTGTVSPVDGEATFSNLSMAQEGTGYRLLASASGLTAATSASFDIVDDVAPAKPVLAQGATSANGFTVQWTAVGDDGSLGTATGQELRYATVPIVTDLDFASATLVPTSTPAAAGSAESATLSGLTPSTSYYVALKVTDNAGNTVRSATLPVSTDNAIVTQLAFITPPEDGTAGTALADVRVALLDENGMTVLTDSSAVTLKLLGAPTFTPVTVHAMSGVATFSGLRIDTAGTGYRLEATSGSLGALQSPVFAIHPAAAASLELVGLASPVTAGEAGTLQVTLHDAFGNVATGYTGTVRFTSSDTAASLPTAHPFTADDAGHASFPGVVLNTAGSRTVTAADTATGSLMDTLTVDVVGGPATQLVLSVPASPLTAGSPFSVQVTLKDGAGNVATGYTGTVRFTSSDGSAVLPAEYVFTADEAGQKTFFPLELRTTGTWSLQAADTASSALSDSHDLTVSAGAVSRLQLTAPATATAGGSFSVTVTARDAFDNVATGYTGTVHFSSGDTGAALPADYTFTAEDTGSRLFNVTPHTAGTHALDVTDGTSSDSANITIAPGAASRVALTGLPGALIAGTSVQVTVTVYDASNNVATGYTGTVHFTSSDAAASLPADHTFTAEDAGQASFPGVVLNTAGSRTVTAADTATGSLMDTLTVNVVSGPAALLVLSVPASPITAGSPFSIQVTLKDGAGNVATGYTGTVRFTSSDSSAVLPAEYTFSADDAGQKTFFPLELRTTGTWSLQAADTASAALLDSHDLTVSAGAVSRLQLTAPATATAGGSFSVTVTARDAFDNVATGYTGTVRFTSSDTAASLPADHTFTAEDAGQASFTGVVLNTAGSRTVTAADTTTGTLTDALTVDVVSGPAAQLVLSVPASPLTAGSPFSIQVTLKDGAGNVATGYTGTVRFASSDSSAVLPAEYTFSADDAGQKTFFPLELRTTGTWSLQAADTASAALSDSHNLTVSAGAVSRLQLTAPATATAGGSFSVTVTARDAFDNVATGYTGTVHFSSGDTGAALPADYTFTAEDTGSRLFNVTPHTAGTHALDVTDGTSSDSANITIAPGAASRVALTGLPGALIAGTPVQVTVTVYDASNNVATGYTGTVHFTSSDPSAVLPEDYPFTPTDAGVATFSVEPRKAGVQTVSVSGDSVGADTASTTVSPANPVVVNIVVQPTSGTVRAPLGPVTVALLDAYDNTASVSTPPVKLTLAGGNPASTLSGPTSVTPSNGVATFYGLSIDQEGSGFRLVVSAMGLMGATSEPFDIVDDLAPAAVVLTAMPSSSSSVTVTWLAVGDDGHVGTASSQELRYATTPITTEGAFSAATPVSLPAPQAPGTTESKVVTGLVLNADHYFALKVFDGAGNSSLSNSPRVDGDKCLGVTCTPPATTCSASGRAIITYTSACDASGGSAVCQDTPTQTLCPSYQTCSAGACVPVTAGSQAGRILISEFSALGSEFIELRNTTAAALDVHGFSLRNAAGQEVTVRAITDPNGTAGTPVLVPANGVRYGIANPSGAIPGGVGFVYGDPGTGFALADTGDALALYAAAPAGNLEDSVDFRSFVTDPNTPLTATRFVGFAGSSTQLDPTVLTASGNDTATNWCVSFHPNGARGARITNTAGALNGSCKVAVINEVLIDPAGTDDTKAFVEIAGPGGSVIGGAKVTDVEGVGSSAGSLNSGDGDVGTGETDGEFVIPAGTRIPADGILLIADANTAVTATTVPGFTAGVDVLAKDMDMENNGGDAIQLISATGTLLDTLGQDTAGANLATNVAVNGLAMYEGGTALTPTAGINNAAPTLARAPLSTDTDNNRNDFHADPSPTPGAPNDAVSFTVASLSPDDGLATTTTTITATGNDFSPGLRVTIGSLASVACTVNSPTSATCTATANTGSAVARLNVTFQNPASVGAPDVVLTNAFTYTGFENETNSAAEADYCNLQFPATFTVKTGLMTPIVYGQLYEAGLTEAPGVPAGVLAEVGYGNNATNPTTHNSWRFFPATYNVQTGNNDEFMGSFTAPTVAASTNYSYTFRFSVDGGFKWTYCDLNGAGSNTGLTFETTQLGVMTVTP